MIEGLKLKGKRIDLGGGEYPKKGFINIDNSTLNPINGHSYTPDINHDLNEGIPFPDSFIDEVFTAHFIEHVKDLKFLLKEIARVCKTGAKITILLPLHDLDNKTHLTDFGFDWFDDNPTKGLKILKKEKRNKDLVDHLYGDRTIEEMEIRFEVVK